MAGLRSLIRCSLFLCVAGCGSTAVTFTCDPVCPAGYHCGESGCLADSAAGDLSASGGGGDMAVTACAPGCSGATPHCNAQNVCVACLSDDHCPAGMVCMQTGATSVCVTGCTSDQGCVALGASMKCCAGACTDSTTDPANCGSCGMVCGAPHAQAVCSASTCAAGACQSGWGDCNHDPGDGCEINLALDAANCGACGAGCTFDHAVSACSSACYIAACTFGWDDCDATPQNGCETSVIADLKNCGACGYSCPPARHALSACTNGSCQLASCSQGFSDCNGDARDGCEATTGSDKLNCGQCNNVCAMGLVCRNGACTCPNCNFPNARSKCINGMCVMGDCVAGWGDCNMSAKDGCEVDVTSDANNCGACNSACPNNVPVCKDSVCTNEVCYDIGYKNCPTGAQQWCDVNPPDATNSVQAQIACSTCFFQQGMGQCQLSNGDCAGPGYSQFSNQQGAPTWGYAVGCSGAAGRVWQYGSSFTNFGRWAP